MMLRQPPGNDRAAHAPARPLRGQALYPVLAGLLCLLLAACATLSEPGPQSSAQADDAEQLYRQGDFSGSASAFLDLAHAHRGDAAAHYRLRAAEALREMGDLAGAAQALDGIRQRNLHGDEVLRLDLLDAEIALKNGDLPRARALLVIADTDLPPHLRMRALELSARAALAAGDPFASAQQRAQLDGLLRGTDREQNRRQLVDSLATLDANTLKARVDALPGNDVLRPWVEQALRSKGQPLARDLARPSRPVGTMQPDASGGLEAQGYQPMHHVALLLPLDASLAAVAQSIRDGFLTAYFGDRAEHRPKLRIYNSGNTPADAVNAYNAAVADGADHVVGPLQRESVGALFHQTLAVPVLALNHPDTGEVPPHGSAEFGLLPDAEGAEVAGHMQQRGIRRAAIIAADADWAGRAARAFRAQFEAGGGAVVGESQLREKEVNYATSILQATAELGQGDDVGVFISMRPQQARLLLPQLRIANVNAPVFATSHVYAGDTNPSLDRDLDGVEFCDAPWLFGPIPGRPDHNAIAARLDSANGVGARLFAFGMDAYALLPYMDWLLTHPDAYLEGATGDLSADGFGRIHRLVGWARFSNGIAQPVDGALSTQPIQQ